MPVSIDLAVLLVYLLSQTQRCTEMLNGTPHNLNGHNSLHTADQLSTFLTSNGIFLN